jgi:hypothetical protein
MRNRAILGISILLFGLAACSYSAAAAPATQRGLVETIVAGTMQAFMSATPIPTETSTETPTPEVPVGWVKYENEQFGFEFAHPNLFNCQDQCGFKAFLGKSEDIDIVTLAVESTLKPGDAPFDGLSFDVLVNAEEASLNDIVNWEWQALTTGPAMIGPPLEKLPYSVGGQEGIKITLVGNMSAIYIPFPSSHQILVVSIGNQSENSFGPTADQVLATLTFTK